MPLFKVPTRAGKEQDTTLAKKLKTPTRQVTSVKGGLLSQISQIKSVVEQYLGKYKDLYQIITTKRELDDYMNDIDSDTYIAIDTETTGLDPMQDKIVGLCLYAKNHKPGYVPINHVSYITGERVENQLTEKEVANSIRKLEHNTRIIMFNSKFDIRVIRNQLGVYLTCYWDCYLASRLMNENEPHKGLKALHQKYVLDDKEDEFRFESLFKGVSADKIPINSFYLYAAHDAIVTYELFEFQKEYLRYDSEREDMRKLAWVFHNIEMPCVETVCDMEDNGIELDIEYAKQLSLSYNEQLKKKTEEFYRLCDSFGKDLDDYRARKGTANKLEYPINISSSSQIAIMLYDVLQIEPPDPKNPRGTGVDILKRIKHPIAEKVLEYRELTKLLSTYIDKLPNCVNPNDGRIHCSFNQYGADTGRFSSSDPNLQNIPSHNKDIRKMFKAQEGYVLMSSDFSQQEPKCLAALCRKHGDSQMYDTFMAGKDLYSEIASKAFNKPYEECKEFREDGTVNKEGKERRTQAKSILLGVLYGRGVPSIAEQLNTTTEKAQQIKDSVFKGFPAIKQFEEDSLDMAYELGYVTTVCGRKRRLPDLQLPEFEFKWKDGVKPNEDVLDFDIGESGEDSVIEVPEDTQRHYLQKLRRCRFGQKRKVFEEANKEGIWIIDNGAKIADAQRQCVNARIQGSAADLTKLAMIELTRNKRLKELGFRLLIPVHDEVIAECPEENREECEKLLAQTMSHAAEEILQMPIKCDVEVTRNWYGEPI